MTNSLPFSKFNFAALALSLIGLMPGLALSQSTNGSFTATASVVQPLTILNTSPLSFGNFVAGPTEAGTVIVSSTGTFTRSSTGGVKLVNSNNGAPAIVNVSGSVGTEYSLSLPESVKLTNSAGGTTMTIASFTSNLPGGTARARITDSGLGSFQIGGTLEVSAGQASGSYSAVVPITINYQ